jgi:hypothetical protein
MFYRWRRMEEEDRGRVWRLYGWFTTLMTCGSCVGAVSWTALLFSLLNVFKANDGITDLAQIASLAALAYSWFSAFLVTYAVEFLCMCAAKLMVLDRMTGFVALQSSYVQTRWAAAGRVVMAAVVLGNAAGLAANVAAAVHYQEAASMMDIASLLYAANNSQSGIQYEAQCQQELQRGGSIASVQSFCEVAVLLLILIAFAVVGLLSARRITSSLLGLDAASPAAASGRTLRLQMACTAAFIFVTFLLRAVFSTMYAVAFELRDADKQCPDELNDCDPTCYNVFTLISLWMSYTPEFQSTIVLISSPLGLLIALWGMTSGRMLQRMTSKNDLSVRLV